MSATLGAAVGITEAPPWMKTPEWGERVLKAPVAGARDHGPDDQNDLAHSEFGKRWIAPKQLDLRLREGEAVSSPGKLKGTKKAGKDQANAVRTCDSRDLANCILRESMSSPGRTVLALLNRADRARALFNKLRAQPGNPDNLLLLHARFRPQDRRAAEGRLLDSAPPSGRIVVSTQVGVARSGAKLPSDVMGCLGGRV